MINVVDRPPSLIYEVDFSQASRHLLTISLWIQRASSNTVSIVFPVWTPGVTWFASTLAMLSR